MDGPRSGIDSLEKLRSGLHNFLSDDPAQPASRRIPVTQPAASAGAGAAPGGLFGDALSWLSAAVENVRSGPLGWTREGGTARGAQPPWRGYVALWPLDARSQRRGARGAA